MFPYHDRAPLHFTDPLPDHADVVIIGGGVIGVTSAWYLRRQGLSVLVCDKGRVAGEQSSRNWGWVRTMLRDPAEVAIARDGVNRWERLAGELGEGIGFRRTGTLVLAESDAEMARCESWLATAADCGVDTRLLAPAEVASLISVPPGDWRGGIHTPADARAEPFTAVRTVAEGLRDRGGMLREACAVRTLESSAGRVSAVVTEHGVVKTPVVVCAAGAWSSLFLANLGIRLPQLAVRATVARTGPVASVFDGAAGLHDLYIRRRLDGGYTVTTETTDHCIGANSLRFFRDFLPARNSTGDLRLRLGRDATQMPFPRRRWSGEGPTPFESCRVLNPEPSKTVLEIIRRRLARRLPGVAGAGIVQAWAGMIDAMPDIVPVMDRVPALDGLFLATGFSGHGFGIGPAAGRVMADLVTGATPPWDISRFRFERFSDGSEIVPGPAI